MKLTPVVDVFAPATATTAVIDVDVMLLLL